jgi:hypothetical protein
LTFEVTRSDPRLFLAKDDEDERIEDFQDFLRLTEIQEEEEADQKEGDEDRDAGAPLRSLAQEMRLLKRDTKMGWFIYGTKHDHVHVFGSGPS